MRNPLTFILVPALLISAVNPASAQRPAPPRPPVPAAAMQSRLPTYQAPDHIAFRTATIMSEGVRLNAEIFSLKTLTGQALPTIIMAHGWGGTAAAFDGMR